MDAVTDATTTKKSARPLRCYFNIGDCARPLEDGHERHKPDICMNCMIMVIMIATDGIMDASHQHDVGYLTNTIRTMTRGLTHLGQDLGLDITTYDKVIMPEKAKPYRAQYIE